MVDTGTSDRDASSESESIAAIKLCSKSASKLIFVVEKHQEKKNCFFVHLYLNGN